MMTYAAFYAGWPNAWAVFNLAKEVYSDETSKEEHGGMFGMGEPNVAYAKYFKCMRSAGVEIEILIEYMSLLEKGKTTVEGRKLLL